MPFFYFQVTLKSFKTLQPKMTNYILLMEEILSCTTWDIENLVNNGIFTIWTGWLAGFLKHQPYDRMTHIHHIISLCAEQPVSPTAGASLSQRRRE